MSLLLFRVSGYVIITVRINMGHHYARVRKTRPIIRMEVILSAEPGMVLQCQHPHDDHAARYSRGSRSGAGFSLGDAGCNVPYEHAHLHRIRLSVLRKMVPPNYGVCPNY